MQERLERTAAGRALISVLLVALLAAIVVVNLPASHLRTALSGATQPVLGAVGVGQAWGVFAPNPPTISTSVEVRVTYADGSTATRSLTGGAGIAAYRDYRLRKFAETLRQDAHQDLWRPFAEYVARAERAAGREPARVALVRYFAQLAPPGPEPDRAPTREYTFFVLDPA